MFCGLFRGGWDYFSAALVEYHRSKVGMLKKLAYRRNVELTSCRRISRNSELPVVRKLLVRVDLLEAHVGAFWHIHAAAAAILYPGINWRQLYKDRSSQKIDSRYYFQENMIS